MLSQFYKPIKLCIQNIFYTFVAKKVLKKVLKLKTQLIYGHHKYQKTILSR